MLIASLFLIVGTAWAQIGALSELDNSKAYHLKNANNMGYAIWKSGDNLTLCGASSTYTDALDASAGGSNWQIIKYQEKYYLYNVGAQKFAVTTGGATYLTEIPTPISIKSVNNGFAFNTTGEWNHYMCASHQSHHSSAPIQFWTDSDNGSAWQIIENTEIASFSNQLNGATFVDTYYSSGFLSGKMYALKEKKSGLYLDIQTLGINEKNAGYTTNNISLNINPCVIYLEFSKGNWKIKNINGGYVYIHDQAGSDGKIRSWNASISTGDKNNCWKFTKVETDVFKISRETDNKYIGADADVANQPLFCDMTDDKKIFKFALVEYTSAALNPQGYYALKLKDESNTFYFNFTAKGDTKATLQTTPTYFYALPSANEKYLLFQNKDNAEQFLGHPAGGWSTTYDCKLWQISEADEDGLVTISRHADTGVDGGKEMGTNDALVAERQLYTNVKNSKRWAIEGTFNLATNGTVVNSNYEFTSDKIYYYNPCNKLRFTLTESGAFFQNGAKRMSLDEFYLYDAQGEEVKLTADNVSGNNNKNYAGMFDRKNDTFGGTSTWTDGTEDDYFEILLPKDVDLGGAFSFKFVTENTTMNAKAFKIETLYQKINTIVYSFAVNAPQDATPTVTYNGEAVAADQTFEEGEFDIELFNATDIPGYTWSVVVNDEDATITILYSATQVVENPQPVVDLVNRIGGEGTADKFKFVHDPSINSKQETFVLGAEDGKILIKGTTISAITTGLGWYLNNVAKINIAWNSLNEKTVSGAAYADLSNLPLPATEETHTSDAKYRYYLNTCTFGYSMTSWTWKRWQQEIDWMALHGINMPLQLVGMEEVWRKFLINQGYSETDAKAFVAGPAFIAWWAMNNLEGWGGTAAGSKSGYNNLPGAGGVQDDAWYARQVKLAKQILDAQRALGMQPVLPGWSGMVPTNFASKSTGKYATRGNGGNWAGDFVRPLLLSVSNANYAEIAADYYACLKEVMGESQYYSMDPFHEGGGTGTTEDYKALYAAMEAAKPGSQWVIQQWQWNAGQKLSLNAVPAGKLIVLDLFSDGSPAFDGYSGYAPQEAVFCAIPNFGGRSGLMGRLQNVTDNYFKFKGKYASIKGIGTAPEAIEQTPVTYDLIYQLPWMNGQKPDVAAWVDNYAVARYGKDNAVVKEAWSLLRQGPLNYGADGIQGPVEDVWAARPNLDANKASSWGVTLANAGGTYTPARRQMLIDAVYKLIDQEDELELTNGSVYKSNYLYDLVEFGGAVMADYAYDLLLGIKAAKNAEGTNGATYKARRDAFLQLILDMDAFRGTNLNFRLGKWTQEARAAAGEVEGATTATPDWYEYNNARTILSTWSSPGTNLTDYSYRSWQGLLKDYYYKRWKYYFDNNCTGAEYKYFEWNWAHGKEHYVGQTGFSDVDLTEEQDGHTSKYTREPEGNTVDIAKSMLAKYIIPVKYDNGTTYYAYRTFTTDLAGKATVNTASGSTVDFTQYFNVPADATITGDFINNDKQSANIMAVPTVKPQEGKSYTGTITLTDGTVLQNFTVVLKEQLINGYYYINYISKESEVPMFIGYDETQDNWEEPIVEFRGYKILGESAYTTDAVADKVFAIMTKGDGFTIAAQGKNLKAPNFNGWNHIQFSDDENEAGVYQFIKQPEHEGAYQIMGVGEDDGNWVHNNYLQVYGIDGKLIVGPNPVDDASLFKLVPATTYAIAQGMTALCLPFNVVLPEGVVAYDIVNASKEALESGENLLEEIASGGDILLAGTPVILRAENATPLTITLGSNGGKTSKANSCLRGNFVKQDLKVEKKKKYVLQEGKFVPLTVDTEISANTCWVVTNIDDENAKIEDGHIIIDGWEFTYTEEKEEAAKGRITLVKCVKEGDPELDIESTYIVNGEKKTVVAIDPEFLHGNETLKKVTIPESMLNLGFREIELMFEGEYEGQPGDGATYEGNQLVGEAKGLHRCYEFPTDKTTGKSYVVGGNDAWKLTLDVTIDDTKKTSYNNFGSAIVSTKENTMDDNYQDYMQIYMWQDLKHIVVKIDNADDRYAYSTYVLDEDGNETSELLVNKHFTFELEHDGAGGYQVVIYYDNGKAKMYNIAASDGHKVKDFDKLYYSLPEGIHVDVKFEKLITHGLFVGCTNLQRIEVDPANPTFMSCEHGVLYDKNQYYVMRIPEGKRNEDGKTDHFEIPSKVVKLYPGAVHGVTADIVLHSNPQIGVVKGHEDHVANAKFYLSLDDIDNTITEKETGFGGARDFVSANNNHYQQARYKRTPLAKDVYGTLCLPFDIKEDNAIMDKYDFYEFRCANETSLIFKQVTELKHNKPYLYKLKDSVEEGYNIDRTTGCDVFKSAGAVNIETLAKFDDSLLEGDITALGAFVNYYVETYKYANKAFYYYKTTDKSFWQVTKKLTYRPYRAFFVVNNVQATQATPRLSLQLLDGTTTDIDATLVEDMFAPELYDLSGRRVLNPVNGGIYIVNGKKVFIK